MPPEVATIEQTDKPISHQKASAVGKSRANSVTGKLKVAIDAMAYEGLDYQQAALKAGLTTRAVRLAIDRPHVKAYYERQLQVFLTSERARNIHRAVGIRDQNGNLTAAMQATKWLHDPQQEAAVQTAGRVSMPGVQIVINMGKRDGAVIPDDRIIELNPLEANEACGTESGNDGEEQG